jgi:hypothetical protein
MSLKLPGPNVVEYGEGGLGVLDGLFLENMELGDVN